MREKAERVACVPACCVPRGPLTRGRLRPLGRAFGHALLLRRADALAGAVGCAVCRVVRWRGGGIAMRTMGDEGGTKGYISLFEGFLTYGGMSVWDDEDVGGRVG